LSINFRHLLLFTPTFFSEWRGTSRETGSSSLRLCHFGYSSCHWEGSARGKGRSRDVACYVSNEPNDHTDYLTRPSGGAMAILHLILQWRHARDLLEGRAKRFRVGVTHLVHHFVDVFTGGLQSHFRGFYFDALNVFHHSVRRRLFEPALQVPSSERKHGCQLVDSDLFLEV